MSAKPVKSGVRDLCIFTTPKSAIQPQSDILSKWLTFEQLNHARTWAVRLELMRSNTLCAFVTDGLVEGELTVLSDDNTSYQVVDMVSYCIPTKNGDCGLPLYILDKMTGGSKIVGIHVAGNSHGIGFSTLVPREDLIEVLETFPHRIKPPKFACEKGSVVCSQGNFDPIGIVPERIYTPTQTVVCRSVLHNTWKISDYEPAVLTVQFKGDVRYDPYELALAKYGVQPTHVDQRVLDAAYDNYAQYFCGMTRNAKFKRLLSFEEACGGIPGETFIDGLCRRSSAGYPWSLKKGAKGKYQFFGTENKFEYISPECMELRQSVMGIIADAKQLQSRQHIYMDVLKDERRKKEKVAACMTRFVSASPVDLTIVNRMYLMAYTKAVQDFRIIDGHAIGINPYSIEWHILAHKLQTKGHKVFDGDFKGFDGSQGI